MPARGQQARALTRYLQRQVRAYSPHYRPLLDQAFRERGGRSGLDMTTLPLTPWSSVTDPRQFVLHPDYGSITRYGEPSLGAKVLWARLLGRTARANRELIDPMYKPIHWLMADGVPIGSSTRDLDRLTELGRAWLQDVVRKPSEVVVSVVPPEPTLGYWQLVLGTRRAGLSSAFLPPDASVAQIARLRPTVLAGRPDDLDRILSGPPEDLAGVRTVLAVDEPLVPGQRARLEAGLLHEDAAVLAAWAPPGVRSLWTECRARSGLHTSPSAEMVEAVDDEIVWTANGWAGTVFVRLRTGVIASLDHRPCPGCGRSTPRVLVDAASPAPAPRPGRTVPAREPEPPEPDVESDVETEAGVDVEAEVDFELDAVEELEPVEPAWAPEPVSNGGAPPAFARVLDEHPGVAVWQAELRVWQGEEELFVFFSPAGPNGPVPVLTDLAGEIGATQFVVLPENELLDRLARHDDRQVVDLR